MSNLVGRDDADVIRVHRPPFGVEGGECDRRALNVPVLVPGDVGLPGALDLELNAPLHRDFRVRRVSVEVKPDWDTRAGPLAESRLDGTDECRLEVRGMGRGEPHVNRRGRAILPAAQRGVPARLEHLAQVGARTARPDAAPCLGARQQLDVRRLATVRTGRDRGPLRAGRGRWCLGRDLGWRRRRWLGDSERRVGIGVRRGGPAGRGFKRVPENEQDDEYDRGGDHPRKPAFHHARNMRRSQAATLALHFARLYDCGPHVLGS